MPPKKSKVKPKDSNNNQEVDANMTDEQTDPILDENFSMAALQHNLEKMIDHRLKQQTDHMNDLFTNHSKSTKADLREIKTSQAFLSSKFDELVGTLNEVKAVNSQLRKDNELLQTRVNNLDKQCAESEAAIESLRQYSRRDTLEFHGIPLIEGEITNAIVVEVAKLAVPDRDFSEAMLSISHRLPTRSGNVPPIIAKFVQREVRDVIYRNRKNLRSKSTENLGYETHNNIYINESLTAKSRAIFTEAKKFRNEHNFKFIWTKNGHVHLKKNDSQTSRTNVFKSMQEFKDFERGFHCQRDQRSPIS
jgi:chaperonin cofactor prefoldin